MTNLEIVEVLRKIEPESDDQALRIAKAMQVLLKNSEGYADSINLYLKPVAFDEIIDKPAAKIYSHYENWCKKEGYTPQSKVAFGKAVCTKFNVVSKVVKIDKVHTRVYKSA